MSDRLDELLDNMKTKEDFIDFIDLLREDYNVNYEEWENPDMDRFLESMSAWTKNIERYYQNRKEEMPKNIPWKVFADILMASKIYE